MFGGLGKGMRAKQLIENGSRRKQQINNILSDCERTNVQCRGYRQQRNWRNV
jgi:hypothetical protein